MDLSYRLFVHVDQEYPHLYSKYEDSVNKHNKSLIDNPYPDSGFDLFFPEQTAVFNSVTNFVNMHITCEMRVYDGDRSKSIGYYSYPRSSISKTSLLLANHVGIIDSGYRGNLIGAFRNLSIEPYIVEQYTRLLQICSPDLRSFTVELVDSDFFEKTKRDIGGFGSTGK